MYALATMSARDNGKRGKTREWKKFEREKTSKRMVGNVVFIVMIWPRGTTTLEKVTLLHVFSQTISYNTGIFFIWEGIT